MSNKVKLIRIRNIMGVENLEFVPSEGVTVISGGNDTGKTSILEALKSLVEGGHDATLLRQGAEEAEVVLVLDDDVELRKRIRPDRSDLEVHHPQAGKVSAPKTYVGKLVDATAFNPVPFIRGDADRVELLLEAIDARVTAAQLAEALEGVPAEECDAAARVEVVAMKPALDAISTVRGSVYMARTGVNRIAKDKRATADQLRAALPEGAEDVDALRAVLQEAKAKVQEELGARERTLGEIQAAYEEEEERIRREADAEVRELEEEIQRLRAKANARRQEQAEKIEQARAERDRRAEDTREAYEVELTNWRDAVSSLGERVKAAEKAKDTRAMVEGAEAEAERREAQSEAMTAALKRLDALRSEVLSGVPIPGLDVQDGEVLVDGIPFDRLNSQRQAEVAVELAKLRAGELGLVVMDGLELLDAKHFAPLMESVAAAGLQAVVTRVTEGPLVVDDW